MLYVQKVLIGLVLIITPAIGLALAKLIIDPLFRNKAVTLEGLVTFFVYGLVAGGILLILRLIIRGGKLT